MVAMASNVPRPLPGVPPALGHARVLDGFRGVAVLAVLGYHLDLPWLRGGYFGVDVFFALSGFLITTLLLEEYGRHRAISLPAFFLRRFWRLYPALVVLVLAAALTSYFHPEVGLARVAIVMTAVLTYWSNWLFIADSGAWAGGLGPTWSLAIEVHFYLLWAITLALALKRWGVRLRPLLALALTVAVASAGWRLILWGCWNQTVHAYCGTDARLDSIFLGAAAALIRCLELSGTTPGPLGRLPAWQVRLIEVLLLAGTGWLVCCETRAYSQWEFFGGFGLVGGATALLILTSLLHPGSLLTGPLQTVLLVWCGRISYSLYLWHQPVTKFITAARLGPLGHRTWLVALIQLAASLTLAVVSYVAIERPGLRLGRKLMAPGQGLGAAG